MATVGYDEQSLLIDGRRLWLVSGSVSYARIPRGLWRERLRAARQAGLNCIEVSVFWNLHEPRPGVFHFEGELDLRHFIRLIAEEGMFCILRPGPYLGADWDSGGLPAWLERSADIRYRQANAPFMEAAARYFSAVMEQVAPLQVTALATPETPSAWTTGGGPVVLMQIENQWLCHHPAQGHTYLAELVRFLRENGCQVPVTQSNHLWQRVEGVIDVWAASERLLSDLRQLRAVQPAAPPMLMEYNAGPATYFGMPETPDDAAAADETIYRLASALAAGAQYNIYPFHGGTRSGFWSGRSIKTQGAAATTGSLSSAPLLEAGGRGPQFHAVKRISTFASQFGQVLAHLSPSRPHSAIAVDQAEHGLSVLHQDGAQGQVVFLFKGHTDTTQQTDLLLPNGLTLPVPLGNDRVAWVILETNLGGTAHLDYTNLRPWAFIQRRMLVLFGPPGAEGVTSIDGAVIHMTVPEDGKPVIEQHDDITLVVLNDHQVDAAYIRPEGLVVGAAGLDDKSEPVADPQWPMAYLINLEGQISQRKMSTVRKAKAPTLGPWDQALLKDMVAGRSDRFQPISGPQTLAQLQCDYGYGWYRVTGVTGGADQVLAPRAGDRLHVYANGDLTEVLGVGPGAEIDPVPLRLADPVVVLADNFGRLSDGWSFGESKGLFDHLYAVKPVRLDKPNVVAGKVPDPFVLSGYWPGLRLGEHQQADALVWSIRAASGSKMVLDLVDFPWRVMVSASGTPLGLYDPAYSAGRARFVINVGKGRVELRLALFDKYDGRTDPLQFMRLYLCAQNLTAKGQWSFAPWTAPGDQDFKAGAGGASRQPAWYRSRFTVTNAAAPLWLEIRRMTKGQIFLNGRNLGRYFVATAAGKEVGSQSKYYLPEPWLHTDKPNELMLFDEHGKSPKHCRLVVE